MSLLQVLARVCPICSRDVARIMPVPIGFVVICDPEAGGCGAFAAAAASDTGAVDKWNRGFPAPYTAGSADCAA